MPTFIKRLHACPSEPVTKLAFEWLVLTATRSGETRGAIWSEIDEAKALWTIPRQRMKANVEHVVPLSRRCLKVAKQARALNPLSDLLFPGSRTGKELSDMTLTKLLRELGCESAQGYLIARPMPAENVVPWIRAWHERRGELLQLDVG